MRNDRYFWYEAGHVNLATIRNIQSQQIIKIRKLLTMQEEGEKNK